MRLSIVSTTGSLLELTVTRGESVEGLRKHISKKLRLQTDKMILLHKDRQLTAGKLQDTGITDGSRLILVPVIKAGYICSTTRPERNFMEVLELLSDAQITEILSGQCPLTVKLAVGAHIMYVQLQLSPKNELWQQKNQDFGAQCNVQPQAAPTTTEIINHPKAYIPITTTLPASQTNVHAISSDSSLESKRHALPAGSTFHATTCRQSSPSPGHPRHPIIPVIETLYPNSPPPAVTSVSTPGIISGQEGTALPSSIKQVPATYQTEVCTQPGAVIDSFMCHSPGVFSGTFSGSLTPEVHTSAALRQSRRGINIILQILGDLLHAASNQKGLLDRPHCFASTTSTTGSLLSRVDQTQSKSRPQRSRVESINETSDNRNAIPSSVKEENYNLHHKLERLQFLMHQRRLYQQNRRSSRVSQTSHPYHKHLKRS